MAWKNESSMEQREEKGKRKKVKVVGVVAWLMELDSLTRVARGLLGDQSLVLWVRDSVGCRWGYTLLVTSCFSAFLLSYFLTHHSQPC